MWILTLGLELSSKFQMLNGTDNARDALKYWTIN